jgi:hypothetical protein
VSAEIIGIKRKPRPLRKAFQPNAPYVVEREDDEHGIRYMVVDQRPDSYREVCALTDWEEQPDPWAKWNAEQIAQGLNLLVAYRLETLPKVKEDL